jgi:putative endopeptidase
VGHTSYVLPTPVGRAYAEVYDLGHAKDFVMRLCKDAIESHKEIVNASEWLSDVSKKNLCEKLDAITIQAVYPEAWEDYSGLDLEGLGFYEARRAIWLFDIKRNAALTNGAVDHRLWNDPTLIKSIAQYHSNDNSFHVAAGSVEPEVTRYEAGEISLGELLGGTTGYCVFHEIGHALDSIDIRLDKDGNSMEGSLLEPADLEEFERRVQKAEKYYDGIVAFEGQNVVGKVCVNEGLTEVCAEQARLAYATKQNGFDYKAFFDARAKMARCLRTPELEQQCILGSDAHPSAYVDVNGSFQMFEEFYETYGVKEGDGMYLAPDARIALW